MIELLYIPEVILSIGVLLIIVIDLYLQKYKYISFFLIQLLLIAALLSAVTEVPQQNYSSYEFSEFTNLIKFILLLGAIIIFQYTYGHLDYINSLKIEYFTISILGLVGTMIMISAYSLLMLYLGIELLSLALYALIGFNKHSGLSSEAAIKYYVLGAMSSGILLFGISLIYGFTGSINYFEIADQVLSLIHI